MEVRARRMARSHGYCQMCEAEGKYGVKAEIVDHIVPLAHGGADTDENTRNVCGEHARKVYAEQFKKKYRRQIALDGWPV